MFNDIMLITASFSFRLPQNNCWKTPLPYYTDRTRTRPLCPSTRTSHNAVVNIFTCRIGCFSRSVRASRYARWTWACSARSRCQSSTTGVSAPSKSSAAMSETGNTWVSCSMYVYLLHYLTWHNHLSIYIYHLLIIYRVT